MVNSTSKLVFEFRILLKELYSVNLFIAFNHACILCSVQGLCSTSCYCLLFQVYPDPVRVVSVGVPVGKMTCNPSSGHAIDNPVEFCRGR